MIKLIASDLDGTLLKEGTMDINPEIYDIIRKLKAKGIVFAAVSGRVYDSIERVFAPVKDGLQLQLLHRKLHRLRKLRRLRHRKCLRQQQV